MFIAMNRFQVLRGQEAAFEAVWLSRETHLETVQGFLEFSRDLVGDRVVTDVREGRGRKG